MCIKGDGEILKAVEDLEVYKAMRVYQIRDILTGEHTIRLKTPFRCLVESAMVKTQVPMRNWRWGYGYGCFASLELAEQYLKKLNKMPWSPLDQFEIIKYRIPKGTLYEYGHIHPGHLGGGMEAMRTRRITLY
jgi:hypothetical protein